MSEVKIAKLAVSTASDEALARALTHVNRDFDGGRITKMELASWLLVRGCENLDEAAIEEARKAHFNQATYLQHLVNKLKRSQRDQLLDTELELLNQVLRKRKATVKASKGTQEVLDSTALIPQKNHS